MIKERIQVRSMAHRKRMRSCCCLYAQAVHGLVHVHALQAWALQPLDRSNEPTHPVRSRSLHHSQRSCSATLPCLQRLATATADARVSSATMQPKTARSKLLLPLRGRCHSLVRTRTAPNARLTLPYQRTAHTPSTFPGLLLIIPPVHTELFGRGYSPFLSAHNARVDLEVATGCCTFTTKA